MRSLSRIIRSGEYTAAVSNYRYTNLEPQISADGKTVSEFIPSQAEKTEQPQADLTQPNQPKQALEQAFLKAKEIINSAQAYSEKTMKEAREDIRNEATEVKQRAYTDGYAKGSREGKREGYDAGYKEGVESGREKADAASRRSLDELSLMIESVEKSKDGILEKFEDGLVNLAASMAKAVLRQELKTNEHAMHDMILSVMEEYRSQEWIRIFVSNETASVLMKADSSIIKDLQDISSSVKVIASADMSNTDCVIETPDQVVDAGADSQISKLQKGIAEAVKIKKTQQ
jgi:flagellar assembly protein FliH